MRLHDLSGRHIAIWGAGVEGRAAVELVNRYGNAASVVVLVDAARPTDPDSVHGVPVIDLSTGPFPADVQVIVKSPGISPYHGRLGEIVSERPDIAVIGGTSLWFSEAAAAPGDPLSRTIAVTGSKGKSTTSSLIAHLLSALTSDVLLAGNVGRAPLDVLAAGLAIGDPFPTSRWHVLELSSFQSSEVQVSPAVGVLTSLFEEHLDWHGTVERYFSDKINLFLHPHGRQVSVAANVGVPDVESWLTRLTADIHGVHMLPYGRPSGFAVAPDGSIIDGFVLDGSGDADGTADRTPRVFVGRNDIPLTGAHNAANVCGALTALRAAGFEPWDHQAVLVDALRSFHPLDHRLQPVGQVGDRLIIDDSLSTAPQAAIAALAAYSDRPVGIIVGGHDRGVDYQPLADAVAVHPSPLVVVGVPQSGHRIGALIEAACAQSGNEGVTVVQVDDFDDAVPVLLQSVPAGGVLLLSPAAPSFGRFADYRERGMRFRTLLGL